MRGYPCEVIVSLMNNALREYGKTVLALGFFCWPAAAWFALTWLGY